MATIDESRLIDIASEFAVYVYYHEFSEQDKKDYSKEPFALFDYFDCGVQDALERFVGTELLDAEEIPTLYEDDEELLCQMLNKADKALEADFDYFQQL